MPRLRPLRTRGREAALLVTLLGTACPVDPPRAGEMIFYCDTDGDCVRGETCSHGVCARADEDAGSAFPDTPAVDGGADAQVAPDSRVPDRATPDSRVTDSAARDSAATDLAPVDVALPDAAGLDAAHLEAGTADTARRDAGSADAGQPDASAPDTSAPDASTPDTSMPDAAQPDLVAPDSGEPWWDPSWGRRRLLSFDNGAQAEDLVDFPVLVALDGDRVDYDQVQDQAQDLRFVDCEDVIPLAHEVELWDAAGRSLVWVKVPRIDGASSSDCIWMYYGNSGAVDGQQPAAVWSAGYEAVYHLGSDLDDSTGSGFDAVDHTTAVSAATLGEGRGFNGVDAWLDIGQGRPILRSSGGATLSAWLRTTDAARVEQVVTISVNNGGQPTSTSRAWLEINAADIRVAARSSDSEGTVALDTTDAPIANDRWYHLVGVIDFSRGWMQAFVDGQLYLEGARAFSQPQTPDTDADSCAIGAQDSGGGAYFAGVIDEVRVARAVRSAAWIAAEHRSESDSGFVVFGPEQQR